MRDAKYHADQNAITYQGVAVRGNQALVAHKRNLAFGMSTATRAPRNMISYNGIPAAVIKPVFQTACRTRFANPTVEDLMRLTRTSLDSSIVSAMLEGVRRLLPPDNSLEGQGLRKVEMANNALQALVAETNFTAQLQKFQPLSMTEQQQSESNRVKTEAGLVNVV
jgi:regulator of protease activity HflC (stomatin/prohibitin superfamily)